MTKPQLVITEGHELGSALTVLGDKAIADSKSASASWAAALIAGMKLMTSHREWGILALKMLEDAGMPSVDEAVNEIVYSLPLKPSEEDESDGT